PRIVDVVVPRPEKHRLTSVESGDLAVQEAAFPKGLISGDVVVGPETLAEFTREAAHTFQVAIGDDDIGAVQQRAGVLSRLKEHAVDRNLREVLLEQVV